MLALPTAPAPQPRRQIFVGTAVFVAATVSLMGGLLALFLRFRSATIDAGETWLPDGTKISMVAANIMWISLLPICIFAQWAVYAAKREDKPHTALALFLTGIIGLAFINAQAFIYATTALPVAQGTYSYLFYAVTGVSMLLAVVGVAFSATTAFRYLGGRTADRAIVSAHALYWYAYSAVFTAVWFVVYVTK
ncbi:MAG: cytochrome c oxidase subunit 3 [Ilumatobacteraceae bacterium]